MHDIGSGNSCPLLGSFSRLGWILHSSFPAIHHLSRWNFDFVFCNAGSRHMLLNLWYFETIQPHKAAIFMSSLWFKTLIQSMFSSNFKQWISNNQQTLTIYKTLQNNINNPADELELEFKRNHMNQMNSVVSFPIIFPIINMAWQWRLGSTSYPDIADRGQNLCSDDLADSWVRSFFLTLVPPTLSSSLSPRVRASLLGYARPSYRVRSSL